MTTPTTFRSTVIADLWRVEGQASRAAFARQLFRGVAFKYVFWMRACAATQRGPWSLRLLYPLCRCCYRHYMFKFGISIPFTTRIGPGFYIGHFGGIVVSDGAEIGRNCNISHGVTIGASNRGQRAGAPVIGDDVYIGPGAKVIGGIRIGDDVAIGANAVVTHDVPSGSVVAGVPARVVSSEGSVGYINRTDYP
jgi:serine O-acetyltransferase